MDDSIFRTYDVRGVYGRDLNTETARCVARAFGKIVKKGVVIIGYDARISSPSLFRALQDELRKNKKFSVWTIGMATTPMFYFAVNTHRAAGGIMVTASHNPKEWNGFKVVGKGARMIGGREIGREVMRARMQKKEWKKEKTRGTVIRKNVIPEYVDFLESYTKVKRPIRVIFDCGNGVAGIVLRKLIPRVKNIDAYFLFSNPDGRFPKRNPNPLASGALTPLARKVRDIGADIGIAFDADADRVFFVDAKGRLIPSYAAMFLFLKVFKEPFVSEILMYHMLRSVGFSGKIFKTKVGTYFIKEKMRKENASVAGEYSGHYYFRDFFFADSGILAAMTLLSALSNEEGSLGKFFDQLPSLFINLVNIPLINLNIARIESILTAKAKKIDFTDGKTFIFKTSWINVRPANTEPLIRFFIAATTKKEMNALTRVIKSRTL